MVTCKTAEPVGLPAVLVSIIPGHSAQWSCDGVPPRHGLGLLASLGHARAHLHRDDPLLVPSAGTNDGALGV